MNILNRVLYSWKYRKHYFEDSQNKRFCSSDGGGENACWHTTRPIRQRWADVEECWRGGNMPGIRHHSSLVIYVGII